MDMIDFGIMKRNDIILFLAVIFVAGVVFAGYKKAHSESGDIVRVTIDGRVTGSYNLKDNKTIELNGGTSIMLIKDGKVLMESADCPDQICVNHRSISSNGESIVCLPHKIVIEIITKEKDIDAIAN